MHEQRRKQASLAKRKLHAFNYFFTQTTENSAGEYLKYDYCN